MRRELFDRIVRDLTLVRDKVPPTLLAYPECRIFWLDRAGMNEVKYEDTEHYAVTKAFLMNPQRMLDRIFADADADADSE